MIETIWFFASLAVIPSAACSMADLLGFKVRWLKSVWWLRHCVVAWLTLACVQGYQHSWLALLSLFMTFAWAMSLRTALALREQVTR